MLKMIKRKVNNNHSFNSTNDDTDLSDVFKEDVRNLSKKGLGEVYNNLLKNIDELTKKQSELENKIEGLTRKNEDYVGKNKTMSEELATKR
jgi:hypothetical protein